MFDSVRFVVSALLLTLCLCACGKREITPEEKNKLSELYHATYQTRNPDEIDHLADQILKHANKLPDNIQIKSLIIHAYSAKGFAADIRKDKIRTIEYLSKAAEKLPEIKDSESYIPLASDIYFVFHHANLDDPVQAEYWLKKMEGLIENAMISSRYTKGNAEYRRFIQVKHAENIITRVEFLMKQKHKPDEAVKILLPQIKIWEFRFRRNPVVPLMRGYDLAAELCFQQKNEEDCCSYAEKCLPLAVQFNQLPEFSDLRLYDLRMKQKKYQPALECCREMLRIKMINNSEMIQLKRKLLIKAADACKKMGNIQAEKDYLFQAEELNPLLEIHKIK